MKNHQKSLDVRTLWKTRQSKERAGKIGCKNTAIPASQPRAVMNDNGDSASFIARRKSRKKKSFSLPLKRKRKKDESPAFKGKSTFDLKPVARTVGQHD